VWGGVSAGCDGRAAGAVLCAVFGSVAASGVPPGWADAATRSAWSAVTVAWVAVVVIFGDGPSSGGQDLPVSTVQLRRALAVLLREGESACSQAAFDVGAGRCADEDLSDLAAGLDALADAVRRYPHLRDEM
jgi:hypothetical protein